MKSIRLLNCIKNKRIFIRCDFNVPINNNQIIDDFKINKSLKTIKYLNEKNPDMIILGSHLGRPNGLNNNKLVLKPVADLLSKKLDQPIYYGNNLNDIPKKSIVLLENLRFNKGEQENDIEFAKKLANLSDIYINDAFAVSHREHASVSKILNFYSDNNKYNGFLLENEKIVLDKLINNKKHPYIVVLGGSKITDKIKIINNLLLHVDNILIGGSLSYCFLKAKGYNIGSTPCTKEDVLIAEKILRNDIYNKIILRIDNVVCDKSSENIFQTDDENIPNESEAFDIGDKTIKLFNSYLENAEQIFWNGPIGMYEKEEFRKGSSELIKIMIKNKNCNVVIGGGETADLFKNLNFNNIHILTGGGASLDYLSKY